MRPYKKRKGRRLQRLIHQHKQALRFSLYVAALVILIIGNIFASFRSDNQPGQRNYTGGNSSPGDNKATGGVQQGLTSIHPNIPLNPKLGIVKQLQTESMFVNPWNNIWRSGGQWERSYIQSAINLQNGGIREWEDYFLSSLGSSIENYQNFTDARLGSFLNLSNQGGGGGNPLGGMIGPPLEYPHSTNYGGGYDTASAGGSLGSMSSGGSGSGSYGPMTNDGPAQIPEPSTLILTAIGLLFLTRRTYSFIAGSQKTN
jgi:hypothetical protein